MSREVEVALYESGEDEPFAHRRFLCVPRPSEVIRFRLDEGKLALRRVSTILLCAATDDFPGEVAVFLSPPKSGGDA